MRRLLFLSMTLCLGFLTAAAAVADDSPPSSSPFRDAPVVQWIDKAIAKQSLKTDIKLFDVNLVNGINLATKYHYDSEPSYIDNYYTRFDIYDSQLGISPAAWVSDLSGPFGLGLASQSQVIFAREFHSQKDAMTAAPYFVNHLPISAKRAIEHLEIGDFVAFQSTLNLSFSLSASAPLSGPLDAQITSAIVMSGTFLVHIYKIDKTKIRLKLIGIHDNSMGGDGGLKLNPGIRLFSVTIKNHTLHRIVDVKPIDIASSFTSSEVLMVDYMLDLADPSVAQAYDRLMQRKVALEVGDAFYSFENDGSLENSFITDFSELQALYHAELAKPAGHRAVDRFFEGSTNVTSVGDSKQLDFYFIGFHDDQFFSESKITTMNESENRHYYLFDNFIINKHRDTFLHFLDRSDNLIANLLFSSDENFVPKNFEALSVSRERRSRSVRFSDISDLQTTVRRVIPQAIYSQIPFMSWNTLPSDAENLYFFHQIFFNLKAFEALPVLSQEQIVVAYDRFLDSIPEPDAIAMVTSHYAGEGGDSDVLPQGLSRYDTDIRFIASKLVKTLDSTLDIKTRYRSFVDLKQNELFQQTGPGFLISILPQDRLPEFIGYSLEVTGKNLNPVTFNYGQPTQTDLYKSMIYIQYLLSTRQVDMRVLKETASGSAPIVPVQNPSQAPRL